MKNENFLKFIDWLQNRQQEISQIEMQAKACIKKSDIEEYKKLMYQKAEILADLVDDALPFLKKLPDGISDDIKHELNSFSMNASEALELNSVFYMSALLFPADYKDGEPDNLQKYIGELKKLNLSCTGISIVIPGESFAGKNIKEKNMLRHIVWWTLKSHTEGQTEADNVYFISNASAELQNNPHAKSIEVSAKVESSSTVPAQVVMLATFENLDKLAAFENDPITKRFENMVKEKATSRNCINYEILSNLS